MNVLPRLVRWLEQTSLPSRTRRRSPRRGRLRPAVECLEDRALPSGLFGTNLIVNGDAEAGTGSATGNDIVDAPGWTQGLNDITVVQYGAPGLLSASDPGPTDRGNNFFAGGPNLSFCSATQVIDVSSAAAAIDAGNVTFTLSGWLGGYQDRSSDASVTLSLNDESGNPLYHPGIGPVTAADRGNVTELLQRTTQGRVTPGTRTIDVELDLHSHTSFADNLSLVLDQGNNGAGPAVTSGDSTTFTVGSPGSFAVTATGSPTPSLTEAGALPGGVTFHDNGDGTATLAGTPDLGTGGVYALSFTAHNGAGADVTQQFNLTVDEAAAITSAANATFAVGTNDSFTVKATGFPVPTLTESGALPQGVTFTDNGNGTATLAGDPAAGSNPAYVITIAAHDGVGPDASQAFTLDVSSDAKLFDEGINVIQPGLENGTLPGENTTISAVFSDDDPNSMVSQFTGVTTIDWGDHTTPTPVNLGDIQPLSSNSTSVTWQIDGAHTYTEGGQYPITIHVVDREGSTLDIPVGTATIPDAPLLVTSEVTSLQTDSSGNPLTEGGPSFSGELLTFADSNTGATPPGPGDYAVTIAWGDGKTETVVPTQPGGPGTEFHVAGTHPFQGAGNFTVHVTITDNKDKSPTQQSASADIPATVADAPVTVPAPPQGIPQATVGQPYYGVVAIITDPDTGAKPSDFSGTITWGAGGGDPTPFGPGNVSSTKSVPGQFSISVSGMHTFPTDGNFSVTVQLTEQDRDGGERNAPVQTVTSMVGKVSVVQPTPGGGPALLQRERQELEDKLTIQEKLHLGILGLTKPPGRHHKPAPPKKRVRKEVSGILSQESQLQSDVQAIASAAGGDPEVLALVQNFESLDSAIQAEANQVLSGGHKRGHA